VTNFAIPVRFDTFLTYYAKVRKIPPDPRKGETKTLIHLYDDGGSLQNELDRWATENYNQNNSYTTCCIQMSHAINMAFHTADPSKMIGTQTRRSDGDSRRTHAQKIKAVANMEFHYIASVDEMKDFLEDTFRDGEEISPPTGSVAAMAAHSKSLIQDRPGILVFMGTSPWGVHTEIWLGDDFNQDFMKGKEFVFGPGWAPVYFWSIGDPTLIDI
jgi:hypothetical protein